MSRVAEFLVRYATPLFGLLLAATGAIAAYLALTGIRFDANIETFFPREDPVIQRYFEFADKYERDDGLLLLGFDHPDVLSGPVLRDLRALTDSIEAIPNVDRVTSLTNLETLRSGPDGLEARPLIEAYGDDATRLAAQRKRALADSLASGYVVNRDGTVTAILVWISPDEPSTYSERKSVLDALSRVTKPYDGRYRFRTTGIPYLRNIYVDSLRVETIKYFFISSVLILLILYLTFRSARGVFLPLLVVYMGVLWTVALMMALGGAVDVLGSTLAAIILVVGVADSIHLLTRYYGSAARGYAKPEALRDMLVRLGSATLLTSVTTAIGFGTLTSSQIVPLRRFGLFTAIGVLVTFIITLVFLTGVLTHLPLPDPTRSERVASGPLYRVLSWIDRVTRRHARLVLSVTALVILLSLAGAARLRINAYVNDDLGPATQAYQDMAFFQERLLSPFPLELLFTAPEPDAFKDPERLKEIDRVARYLESRPEVKRTLFVGDLLERVNQVMHADSAAFHRLPASPATTAEYLFLLELTDSDLLERLMDLDYSEIRLSVLMDDIGSYAMQGFMADLDSVLATSLDPDLAVTRTGTIVLAMSIGGHLTNSLLYSIALALLFISLIMGFLFRDPKLLLISLIPNVVPLLVTAGIMGFIGIDIKPATAVIFTIALGIAVDDTIHVLARLRQEVRLTPTLTEAVRNTLLGTGKAIIFTSLILIGGFFVLVTSAFESSAALGALVSVTILMALLADLFLLPSLIHLWKPRMPGARSE